jgi:hypothetical protein
MVRGGWFLLIGAMGCSSEGEVACEGLRVAVSVSDSNDAVISDAAVFMAPDGVVDPAEEISCTGNGDGTYECVVPEPGEYKLYVEPVIPADGSAFYETYGTTVFVEEPEDCEAPAATHDAVLRFESGGA